MAALGAVLFSSCYNKSRLSQLDHGPWEYEQIGVDTTAITSYEEYDEEIDWDFTPRLVIGITVDQMRYDYLTRYNQDFFMEPNVS